jgi:Uma2 family endonuclease
MDAQTIASTEGVHPLSRDAYERLVDLGVFDEARVELLYGVVVPMSLQKAPHAATVARLVEKMILALAGRASVRAHSPFAASEDSEPEPDVAVVPSGDYETEHPSSAYLLVEVAESSVQRDRGPKLRVYADAGVPEYWIIDLGRRVIEVWQAPSDGEYRSLSTFSGADSVVLTAFPDVRFSVGDLLPKS